MLDYTKAKKNYLTIKLMDGTTLFVGMPKKNVFSALVSLRELMITAQADNLEAIDEIYSLAALILSNNKAKKEITAEYIGEMFDTDDIKQLYNAYIEFTQGEVTADPN